MVNADAARCERRAQHSVRASAIEQHDRWRLLNGAQKPVEANGQDDIRARLASFA